MKKPRWFCAIPALGFLLASYGCGTHGHYDSFSAAPRDEVGRSVLRFRWKQILSDYAKEPAPHEFASPVATKEFVYAASRKGVLSAFAVADGAVRWQKKVGSVSARLTIHNDQSDGPQIYVGTDDGELVRVAALDGRSKWTATTGGPVLEAPVVFGDAVYVSNEANQVYALDRKTGKERWKHQSPNPSEFTLRGHAGVSVDGDLVFAGFANGTVAALQATTGKVVWMASLKNGEKRFVDVDTAVVVDGRRLYAASSAGGLFALSKKTGQILWRVDIRNVAGIVLDQERLFVVAANAGVYALNKRGQILWRQSTMGGGEPAQPVIVGEYLIYALSLDGVYVANKRNGKIYQYFNPGEGISSTPFVTALPGTSRVGNLYLLSNAGILYAMSLR